MSARLKDHLGDAQLILAIELSKVPRNDLFELYLRSNALDVRYMLSRRLIRYGEQHREQQERQRFHRCVLSSISRRLSDHRPACTRHPAVIILDFGVQLAAAAVLLEEGV